MYNDGSTCSDCATECNECSGGGASTDCTDCATNYYDEGEDCVATCSIPNFGAAGTC
jgi:hypothetical protein